MEIHKMANLSSARTNSAPAFTYVGCNCFETMVKKIAIKKLKRYNIVFTCMESRATAIEILDNMSIDAFINALRCFISIRGPIRQLHTDQGTNFIDAAKELSRAMGEDKSAFKSFANDNHFDCVTNTLHSSHMRGVWESHIRTIRSVLNGILANRSIRLNTNTLQTFLYEAMAIINCRPMVNCSDNDPNSLSQDQLLTMKTQVVLPLPGEFDTEDIYSRK